MLSERTEKEYAQIYAQYIVDQSACVTRILTNASLIAKEVQASVYLA